MKKISILILFALILVTLIKCCFEKRAVSEKSEKNPSYSNKTNFRYDYKVKSAAYWTSPIMQKSDLNNLAKHDIVIADLENLFNNRESLLELKKLNPNLKLFCYSNPMEIFLTKYQDRLWQNKVIDEIVTNRQDWLLRTINNGKESFAKFWPGMTMLNLSSTCPNVWFQNYSSWMANKLCSEILSDTIWDGYFQDNCTANISWVHANKIDKIDIDGNGKAENNLFIDKKWKEGIDKYLSIINKTGLPIIANKGDLNFINYTSGKFFEKFPNDYLGNKLAGGWYQCMSNAKRTGKFTIFQVSKNDLMFGLASSLLLDNVYIAIDQDDTSYFNELNIDLGRPLGKMKSINSSFIRKYEKGIVIVKPLSRHGEIRLVKVRT